MTIDLHIHSLYSDGTFSPADLVRIAQKRHIAAISITDHDTLAGIDEALTTAKNYDLEVVPGIELSVEHNETQIHILGYLMDHKCQDFNEKINKLQLARNTRNIKIIEKLNDLGKSISLEEVRSLSKIGQTGRPHVAQILCKKGYVRNMNEAFDRYLKKGAAAYVSRFVYSVTDAINMIRNAGGISVLAHPMLIDPSLTTFAKLLHELVGLGLDGVEMYYPTHTAKTRKKLRNICAPYELLFTGGSDYHGDIRKGTSLAGGTNVFVPPELLEKMKEMVASR